MDLRLYTKVFFFTVAIVFTFFNIKDRFNSERVRLEDIILVKIHMNALSIIISMRRPEPFKMSNKKTKNQRIAALEDSTASVE